MKKILFTSTLAILFVFSACTYRQSQPAYSELTYHEKLELLSDSIKVDDIVVKNLFKSQILAHQGTQYDSALIIENVYEAHKELWDCCYGLIFGEDNASKFNTPDGMLEWNRILYPQNMDFEFVRTKTVIGQCIQLLRA